MKNQNDQLNLFTDKAFEPRVIEQAEPMKDETNLEKPQVGVCHVGNDCFYYLGVGTCVLHGDIWDCIDCDDYKSINDDDNEDDD